MQAWRARAPRRCGTAMQGVAKEQNGQIEPQANVRLPEQQGITQTIIDTGVIMNYRPIR